MVRGTPKTTKKRPVAKKKTTTTTTTITPVKKETNNGTKGMNTKGTYYPRGSRFVMNPGRPNLPYVKYGKYAGNLSKLESLAYFDATNPKNISRALPVPNGLGFSTTLNFSTRFQMTALTTANTAQYLIIQLGPSGLVAFSYTHNSATPALAAITPYYFPDLDSQPPDHIRASRLSASMINLTSYNAISGSVSVLSVPSGLEYEFDPTLLSVSTVFQNSIRNMIDTNAKTKLYSGTQFVGNTNNNKIHLVPVSINNLSTWRKYNFCTLANAAAHTAAPYLANDIAYQKAALLSANEEFTHSTLIARFDTTGTTNNYQVVINAQYSARYPSNSLISSISQRVDVSDVPSLERHSNNLNGEGQTAAHTNSGGTF